MNAVLIPDSTSLDKDALDSVLILDPGTIREFVDAREIAGIDRFDEVWEGRLVVPPMPNNEHYILAMKLTEAFSAVIDWDRGDYALPGGNLSDREDWKSNYRAPDAIVILAAGACENRESHWYGGPDLVLEILSPGEKKFAKFDFYAKIGTREVLIVDRKPWSIELFRLVEGKLVSAGLSNLANPQWLASQSLPLTFRLLPGKSRPQIEIVQLETGKRWLA